METVIRHVLIGKTAEFPSGLGKTVTIGSKEIAVFKLENGEFRAIENRCPHKGGVLAEGMVSGTFVYCPMHDWKICLTDGNVQAPDKGCVKTFHVDVHGGEVFILL
ncbi:nitrite reductase small subunit NirD [Bacillota bacterium Lsc_1132]